MNEIEYAERCVRQYKLRARTRCTGDRVIACGGGLFDLFSGVGWTNHSRYRVVRTQNARQLIQVSGTTLSREYRNELLKESQ